MLLVGGGEDSQTENFYVLLQSFYNENGKKVHNAVKYSCNYF